MQAQDVRREWLTVLDPEAVNLLMASRDRSPLGPFLQGPTTVSQLASTLGLSISAASRLVQKLLRLELIVLYHEQRRQGRPVRYYRAAAGTFFVPFQVSDARSLADDWAETEALWARDLGRQIGLALEREMPELNAWGTHFFTDEQGRVRVDVGPAPQGTADLPWPADVVSWWATLRLTRAQATTLAAELQSLFQRYYEAAPALAESCREYRLRLALTPTAQSLP